MLLFTVIFTACSGGGQKSEATKSNAMFTGAKGEVKLMTLDPVIFMQHWYKKPCWIRLILQYISMHRRAGTAGTSKLDKQL